MVFEVIPISPIVQKTVIPTEHIAANTPTTLRSIRVNTMITVRSGLLSLLVTGGYKLKEKGWSPWEALERWWKGVPDYSIPVTVHEGAFTFNAKDKIKILPFEATTE